jgi:divalent metal cation (Fe/Co/Zn/Cd) transporter
MMDNVLGYVEIGVVMVVLLAVCQKFRRIRGFGWLAAVSVVGVVLKLIETWILFFLVIRPHASSAIADALTHRFDQIVTILCLAALTFALYQLGGKPAKGFWHWLFSDNTSAEALSN